MVLLAAAICTKSGKAIISRQFVEMSKPRIEGLLAAFPKLLGSTVGTSRQHTFVETESVRYVYQPLEKLYMLLITTKASNILEDLETLRLFSRVIPEYCRNMDEKDIIDNSFNLIFAFDEIVALGYRESVNLAQIRTFVEMDSHEERVYQAVRQTQEREAKQKMREKAKELQKQRMEAVKRGGKPSYFGSGGSGGFGSGSVPSAPSVGDIAFAPEPGLPKSPYKSPTKPSGPSRALKLGGKGKDVDSFVDQLKSEGETVVNNPPPVKSGSIPSPVAKITPPQHTEPVHLRIEEKITLTASREGGLQNMEVQGLMTLRISEQTFGFIRVMLENRDKRGIQVQTHPNVDKELFKRKGEIGLKNSSKSFPLNTDVGVLKWRLQTQDESLIPLSINCWPSENNRGGCDVNIEYDLQDESLELNDVTITIPLRAGPGVPPPVVAEFDGEYFHNTKLSALQWKLPLIDASNKSGAMEFAASGAPDDFFPVNVSFVTQKAYSDITIVDVKQVQDGSSVKHSLEEIFFPEKYEIV